MAATYGYAGDFSSDDDEKIEQIQERMVQTRFDNTVAPNKKQIEEAIESIKRLPFDQEITLSDDILAGLLDYYKTQRGPIVDSTRKLYNKIALRLIRGDQQEIVVSGDGVKTKEATNGNSQQATINNVNSIDIISKGAPQHSATDTFSSDDDDIIEPVNNKAKRFDSRVAYNNNVVVDGDEDDDRMDIDSETPTGPIRNTRQVELSTSTDDSSSDDDASESDDDSSSESDNGALEVTPIKPPASASREKKAIEVLMAMRPNTPKQAESSVKRQPLAHSTPKDSILETAKKPYTRSQRIATRSATRTSSKASEASKVNSKEASTSSSDVFLESKRVSRKKYTLVTVALLVLLIAFSLFYFKTSIINTAEPLLRKKISF